MPAIVRLILRDLLVVGVLLAALIVVGIATGALGHGVNIRA